MSRVIVFDTETTGFSDEDRVIELAVADYENSEIIFHDLFNPGMPIPPKIQEITKITDEMVSNKAPFAQHAMSISALLKNADVILGYNPSFDRRMLANELRRCGVEIKWPLLVDAKRIWDIYEPREERNLTNAYKRFVDKNGFEGAHGARADTLATLAVIQAQKNEFSLHDTAWDTLDPERKEWWGPSHHLKVVDGVITVNFGKNVSRPVVEIDLGFWRWVCEKDFPPHVILIAMKIREHYRLSRDELSRRLHTWAEAYALKNF